MDRISDRAGVYRTSPVAERYVAEVTFYPGEVMADAAISIAVPDEFAQHGRWRAFRDPVGRGQFPCVAPRGNPPGCAGYRVRVRRGLGLHPPVVPAVRGRHPVCPSHQCVGDLRPVVGRGLSRQLHAACAVGQWVVDVRRLSSSDSTSSGFRAPCTAPFLARCLSRVAQPMVFIALAMPTSHRSDGVPRDRALWPSRRSPDHRHSGRKACGSKTVGPMSRCS